MEGRFGNKRGPISPIFLGKRVVTGGVAPVSESLRAGGYHP